MSQYVIISGNIGSSIYWYWGVKNDMDDVKGSFWVFYRYQGASPIIYDSAESAESDMCEINVLVAERTARIVSLDEFIMLRIMAS